MISQMNVEVQTLMKANSELERSLAEMQDSPISKLDESSSSLMR